MDPLSGSAARAWTWPPSASAQRRLGWGFAAFGGVGLALLLVCGLVVAKTLGDVADAATGLAQQRAALTAMLQPAATSLRDAAASAQHAGASLTQSAAAARDGAALTTQLASAMDEMNQLASLDILGTKPFASAGSSFADLATRSRALSTSLSQTADSLSANVTDSQGVATDLGNLADQLDALNASVGTTDASAIDTGFGALRLLLLALLAWLAVPAIASLWLGRRLLRRG